MLRVFEHKQCNRTVIIASNYIVAGSFALVLSQKTQAAPVVYYFGAVLGLFFFSAFLVFSKAIKTKGIAGAVTIGRLSLAIPVVLSISFWGETPVITDILSLALVFIVILTWEGKIGKLSPILLALFLLFGCIDSAVKFFKLKFPQTDDSFFLIIVFFSAMVWGWLYVFFTRQQPKIREIGGGMLIGIPNYFSTYFILRALETIPAYITFPFINIGMIILSALSGYFLFKEKLSRKKIVLLFLGAAAVLLLTYRFA